MIKHYYWPTPNGHTTAIMREAVELEYEVCTLNILEGEQFDPAFIAISTNNRVPAIVDTEGPRGEPYAVFESGAILMYLAEKTGQFLPTSAAARAKVMEWSFWQMSGLGPMMGQASYFINSAPEQIPYAIDRYISESARLMNVLNTQLADHEYVAGDYSIADMLIYPWLSVGYELIKTAKPEVIGEGAHVGRWLKLVGDRPAVQKGMLVPVV